MSEKIPIPYISGAFKHVLSPPGQKNDPLKRQWYINDHCFFVDKTGLIHWFGITNPYPKNRDYYDSGTHLHTGHAVAKSPFGPWEEKQDALSLPEGSTDNIGACFVAERGNEYLMIIGYNSGFDRAVSKNLDDWSWEVKDSKIKLGEGTRDPCLLKLDDGTWLLYGAAGHGECGAVGLASSKDLKTWKVEEPALISDVPGSWGSLESPFVLHRKGWYYLFLNHSHRQYEETIVFASRSPRKFDWNKPLCTIFAHAAEILTWKGKTYISHCGIEDRHWDDTKAPYGLYMAELKWIE